MLKQDEYTNQFLGAIDLMVEHAISKIKMDRVIVCTIIDNTYAKTQGKYKVSDGTVKFDVQSEYTDYRVDEQVRVQISANTEEKFIIGRYTTTNSEKPITYIPPLGDVLQMRSYNDTAVYPFTLTGPDKQGNPTPKSQQIFDNRKLDNDIQTFLLNDIYDTIFLSVDVQTLLSSYNIVSGEYGFRIELYTQLPDGTPGLTESLYFGSKEMMGNPYSFSIFTNQAAKFSMSNLDLRITGFSLWITQDGNFQYLTSKNTIESIEVFNGGSNIKVKNITIGFGNYLYNIEDNTVKLVTADPLTYSVDDEKKIKGENGQESIVSPQKTLELIWYNKDESGKYIGFTDGKVESAISEDPNKDVKMSAVLIGEDLIKFVDEESYQKVVAKDNRLKNQWSYDVPIDENGLEFSARLQELKDKLNQINDYLSRDYWQTVNNALYEIKEASPENLQTLQKLISQGSFLASLTNKNSEYESSSQEEKNFSSETILELCNYYKDFLAKCAAAANPPLLTSDERTTANYEEKLKKYQEEANATDWYPKEIKDYFYGENNKSGLVGLLENIYFYSKLVLADLETKDFPKKQKEIDYYKKALTKNIDWLDDQFDFDSETFTITKFPFSKKDLTNLFSYYNSDPNRERKIFSEYPEYSNGYCVYWKQYDPKEGVWKNIEGSGYTTYNTLSVGLNISRTKEKYKVLLYFNHVEHSTEELEFTLDKPTEELIEKGNIRIVHGEDSKEAYQCYLSNGLLADKRESSVIRELFAQFIGNDGYVHQDFFKDSQITWTMPLGSSTMLTYNEDWMKDKGFTVIKDEINNIVSFYKSFLLNEEIDSKFYYMIKSFYSPQAKNNTITCAVSKSIGDTVDTYDKTASISINFTSFGNSGTDYTLTVFSETPQRGLTFDNIYTNPWELTVKLYDSLGKEMKFPDEIEVSIIGEKEGKESEVQCEKSGNKCRIYYSDIGTKNECAVLKVVATNIPRTTNSNDKLTLTTFFTIPFSQNKNYQVNGTDSIIYSSLGVEPQYYKEPYELQEWNQGQLTNYKEEFFSISLNSNGLKSAPQLLNNRSILASIMYITGEGIEDNIFPVVIFKDGAENIIWKQPIIIIQNKYSSPMINSWDGELKIDEENNTILSAMMGAGKKNSNNTFSGVLLGDVELKLDNTDDHSGIGIYGFHEGAQSFGFNVDGTAFLGKSGKGRIEFNGDDGYIYSSNYVESQNDLPPLNNGCYYEDEKIKIFPDNSSNTKISVSIKYLDENGESQQKIYTDVSFKKGLFTWYEDGEKKKKRVYASGTSTHGMLIDLQNGYIDAYNFKLTAGDKLLIDANGTNGKYFIMGTPEGQHIYLTDDGLDIKVGELDVTATELNIVVPDPNDSSKNIFKLVAVPSTYSRTFELTTDNFSITADGKITAKVGEIGGITLKEDGLYQGVYNKPASIIGFIEGSEVNKRFDLNNWVEKEDNTINQTGVIDITNYNSTASSVWYNTIYQIRTDINSNFMVDISSYTGRVELYVVKEMPDENQSAFSVVKRVIAKQLEIEAEWKGYYLVVNRAKESIVISTQEKKIDSFEEAGFSLNKQGILQANQAIIRGEIYATNGSFSGDVRANSFATNKKITLGETVRKKYDFKNLENIGESFAHDVVGFSVSQLNTNFVSISSVFLNKIEVSDFKGSTTSDWYVGGYQLDEGGNLTVNIVYDNVQDTEFKVNICEITVIGTTANSNQTVSAFQVTESGQVYFNVGQLGPWRADLNGLFLEFSDATQWKDELAEYVQLSKDGINLKYGDTNTVLTWEHLITLSQKMNQIEALQ